jgi:pyruvate dehydrogenase E2 component (dihydrolipoamide acetyltransferase)
MRYIFKFPDIGEGLEEGTIVEWHVEKGQKVESGDNLVTMETDKVVTGIPSPKSGTLVNLFGKVGETINVGDALVEIELEGDESTEDPKDTKPHVEVVEEEGAGVVGTLEIAGSGAVLSASTEGVTESTEEKPKARKTLATPVARAMAKDMGVDINKVTGTGPAGRVMKEDILNYVQSAQSAAPATSGSTQALAAEENPVEVVPMTQIRKTIARNMIQSKHNAAHMTLFEEVEISELDRIRKKFKEKLAAEGIKLTYLAFVVKATAMALREYKSLNAQMDMDAGNMIYKKYYNIGIAVDTDKGLMVPVIRHADKLSISDIARQITGFSEKARTGQITMEDMQDGTFTITSYGSIGGVFAVPVINYPQAGILGVGRISKQPVVKDDELAIGLMMPLSLSVDHRIADGGETARFVNRIMEFLAEPSALLF